MSDVIITLVHGTWATEASWTQTTSALAKELTEALPTVHFERFIWSGSNSHYSRSSAAIKLRRHIRECTIRYATQDHYIIAHSHGGNVVLYALRDDSTAKCVRGVVCLSTPFINCRKRELGTAGLWSVLSFLSVSFVLILSHATEVLIPDMGWKLAFIAAVSTVLICFSALSRLFDLSSLGDSQSGIYPQRSIGWLIRLVFPHYLPTTFWWYAPQETKLRAYLLCPTSSRFY